MCIKEREKKVAMNGIGIDMSSMALITRRRLEFELKSGQPFMWYDGQWRPAGGIEACSPTAMIRFHRNGHVAWLNSRPGYAQRIMFADVKSRGVIGTAEITAQGSVLCSNGKGLGIDNIWQLLCRTQLTAIIGMEPGGTIMLWDAIGEVIGEFVYPRGARHWNIPEEFESQSPPYDIPELMNVHRDSDNMSMRSRGRHECEEQLLRECRGNDTVRARVLHHLNQPCSSQMANERDNQETLRRKIEMRAAAHALAKRNDTVVVRKSSKAIESDDDDGSASTEEPVSQRMQRLEVGCDEEKIKGEEDSGKEAAEVKDERGVGEQTDEPSTGEENSTQFDPMVRPNENNSTILFGPASDTIQFGPIALVNGEYRQWIMVAPPGMHMHVDAYERRWIHISGECETCFPKKEKKSDDE